MPVIKQYKCDGCGGEKREANKWWVLWLGTGMLNLQTLEQAERTGLTDGMLILCGHECASKKVSQFMGSAH